jgi:hypothetical protein
MFTTAEALKNRTKGIILSAVEKCIAFYRFHNLKVRWIFADNEFEPIKDPILIKHGASVDTAAMEEQVPEIERNIRVVKDRIRSTLAGIPYEKLPTNFKRELVLSCVMLLNMVPRRAGLSPVLSPWSLVTSRVLDYRKHFKVKSGEFCLVHEENSPTNTMKERASEAIAIGPCPSLHGHFRFMVLSTGRIVVRRSFTRLTITERVRQRVHELAGENDKHVEFTYKGTTFSTEDPYVPDDSSDSDSDSDAGSDDEDEVEEEKEDGDQTAPTADEADEGADDLSNDGQELNEDTELPDEGTGEPDALPVDLDDEIGPETDESDIEGDDPKEIEGVSDDEGEPVRSTRSAPSGRFYRLDESNKATLAAQLKKSRPDPMYEKDYEIGMSYLQTGIVNEKGKCFNQLALSQEVCVLTCPKDTLSLNQMSLKKGLEAFGERAEVAVKKEFTQFHTQDVLRPKYAAALSFIEKQEAMRLIMTIKEKKSGDIKGRGCADGRGMRGRIRPQDATSPTVSSEAFAMTCAIDAWEGRVVVTCDVPGAYLHCVMDELCHVLLEGVMVDLYLKVNPSAAKMVEVGRNGKKRLFTRMHKALYGHMRSGRLFWENISSKLKGLGFESKTRMTCAS